MSGSKTGLFEDVVLVGEVDVEEIGVDRFRGNEFSGVGEAGEEIVDAGEVGDDVFMEREEWAGRSGSMASEGWDNDLLRRFLKLSSL